MIFGYNFLNGLIYFLGSLQFGFVLNFPSLAIDGLIDEYPNWNDEKDKKFISFFTNFTSLFGSIGGFIIYFVIKLTSRRTAACIYSGIGVILWLLYFALTPSRFPLGIVFRSLQGIQIGGFTCLTPLLFTDSVPEDKVGVFGCMNQFGIVLGMVIFHLLGAFVNFHILTIIAAILSFLYCGLIWVTPKQIERSESIFQKKYLKPSFIGVMSMILQQLCGINAMLDNLHEIMSRSGLIMTKYLQSTIATSAQLLSVFISAYNMDGIGRRRMWVFSAIGLVISQLLYIISLAIDLGGWVQATSIFLLMIFFGHGLGPIPWFISHDLFPPQVRLAGQSIITFGNMMCSFAVVYIFPIMTEKLNEEAVISIFAVFTVLAIPFGLYFLPKNYDKSAYSITVI